MARTLKPSFIQGQESAPEGNSKFIHTNRANVVFSSKSHSAGKGAIITINDFDIFVAITGNRVLIEAKQIYKESRN